MTSEVFKTLKSASEILDDKCLKTMNLNLVIDDLLTARALIDRAIDTLLDSETEEVFEIDSTGMHDPANYYTQQEKDNYKKNNDFQYPNG